MNEEPEQLKPWSTIWYNPRGTIRDILATHPNQYLLLLVVGGGLGQAFNYAGTFAMGDTFSVSQVLGVIVLLGPLSALISLYLWGWLLHWTSRWLGGIATAAELRIAVAWSWAPVVYLLPMWGVRYILFRHEMFTTQQPFIESHELLSALYGFFNVVDFLVSIMSLFILFNTVSEVNKFSVWRSILAIGLLMLLLTVPFLVLVSLMGPM